MKQLFAVLFIMLLGASYAFANTNAKTEATPQGPAPGRYVVGDARAAGAIIIYTDDAYSMPPAAIVALNNLGYAYTWYSADPFGFETALQQRPWDIILVSHCTYFALSYAWDDILAQMMNGATVGIDTFDGDASDDYSGAGPALFDAVGAQAISDRPFVTVDNIQLDPDFAFWQGLAGMVVPWLGGIGYGDNGDFIDSVEPWAVVTARWWSDQRPNNIRRWRSPCSWLDLWILDFNFNFGTTVEMWMARLIWLDVSPTATQNETWGKVKAMFK